MTNPHSTAEDYDRIFDTAGRWITGQNIGSGGGAF